MSGPKFETGASFSGAQEHDSSSEDVSVSIPTLEEEQAIERRVVTVPSTTEELREGREVNNVWRLRFGSKEMLLYFNTVSNDFTTYLAKMREEKVQGETTAIYREARHLMVEKARELGRPVSYVLMTKVSSMVAWAQGNGDALFSWQKVTGPEEDGSWSFFTEIRPA